MRSAPATWLLKPPAFRQVTSQGGQDGALEYVFHHIGTTNKYYVVCQYSRSTSPGGPHGVVTTCKSARINIFALQQEFGFNNDAHDQGSGSNTYHLKHQYGWTGLLMDGDHSNSSISLHREKISPSNIIDLFEKHAVPLEPDFVSIDVDSTDLWILRAILASPYRPRVLTVEYNCVYGALPIAGTHPDDPDIPWQGDNVHGASFFAIDMVSREFGWTVALRVDGLDAVLIRNDLIEHVAKPSLTFQVPECAGHHPAAPDRAAIVLDYNTWRLTGDAAAARAALSEQLKRYGMDFTRPGARV